MKKFFFLPLVMLLFGSVAFAQMETTSPMWALGVNVGYGLPTGDFKDAYDGGLTVGASGCYMFTKMYGLEVAAQWSKFPANDDLIDALKFISGSDDVDANFQFLPVMADFVVDIPVNAPVIPYLKAGVGIYFETGEVTIAGEKETDTNNDFGFNVAGGVKLPVSETTAIDVGARFHNVNTESKSTQYFTFSAGVEFMF